MKTILITLLISPMILVSMEPMVVDQRKQDKSDEQEFNSFPKKYCAQIAALKQKNAGVAAYIEGELIPYNYDSRPESLFESATWCTTNMSNSNSVLEHQFWVSKYAKQPLLRFDNDTTNDLNRFGNPLSNGEDLFCYDGPNNDVNPGQEGRHNGVILIGHSYKSTQGIPQTVFHLFKQHGISAQDYKGVQPKIKTHGGSHQALEYDQFPFTSDRLVSHTLILTALAAKKRGAIATFDGEKKHHLHIFEYTYKENTTDEDEADQIFKTKMVATAKGTPHFKRLAWLYGKTLIGITNQNELYVVALNLPANVSQKATISCIKQKTSKGYKDLALGRPDNHHELVLVDEKDQLYYTNLKEHQGPNAAFVLKKITEKNATTKKGKSQKVATSADAEKTSEPWIEKVWIYGDKVGLMWKHKVYRLDFNLMRWPEEKNLQFLSLYHAGWNAGVVNKKLCELYEKHMAKKEKQVSTNKNKKRSRKR